MSGDWRILTGFSLVLLSWGVTLIATIDAVFLAWVMGVTAWALMLWEHDTRHGHKR